jgi:hypothetical protein
MLRRFTGVHISDFGCAFNAYRRDAVEPVLGAIGKQFTKALVLPPAPASWRSTSGTLPAPTRPATRRSASCGRRSASLPASGRAVQWIGPPSGRSAPSSRSRSASTASPTGSTTQLPGPALRRRRDPVRPRDPGFILALVGEYLGHPTSAVR